MSAFILSRVFIAVLFVLLVSASGPTTVLADQEPGGGDSAGVISRPSPPAAADTLSSTTAATLSTRGGANPAPEAPVTIHGQVFKAVTTDTSINQLFSMTFPNDPVTVAPKTDQHFHVDMHKALYKGKSIVNYIFDYRAFGPSTEGADLILHEHAKYKSVEAVAYHKQRESDDKHLQVVANIMQLGMGLGMPGTRRGDKLTNSSLDSLRGLIGEEKTAQALATLQTYSKTLTFPQSLKSRNLWDMKERDQKIGKIVDAATSSDPIMQQTKTHLHKYNRHGTLAIHVTGALETALSIASFTPTIAAPACPSGPTRG